MGDTVTAGRADATAMNMPMTDTCAQSPSDAKGSHAVPMTIDDYRREGIIYISWYILFLFPIALVTAVLSESSYYTAYRMCVKVLMIYLSPALVFFIIIMIAVVIRLCCELYWYCSSRNSYRYY
jgi:hypothetical protein